MISQAMAEALGLSETDLENLKVNEDGIILLDRFASVWNNHELVRASWNEELNSLKSDQTRLQSDSDQKIHQLERQLATQSQLLREHSENRNQLSGDLSITVGQLEQSKEEVESLREEHQKISEQLASSQHDKQQADLDMRQMAQVAERRSGEIERLNAEWRDMSEKLTAALTAKVDAESKLEEVDSASISTQLREKRLEQEKGMLASQVEWLTQELKTKSEELLAARKEKSSMSLELQTNLNKAQDDLTASQTTATSLRELLQEREVKLESLMKQVKELRDERLDMESQFKNELSYQTRLADLHKEAAADAKQKFDELVDGARNLQELLSAASQGREEAEQQLAAKEAASLETIQELELKVGAMERELANANDLLNVARQRGQTPLTGQQVVDMSPRAASTSARLQSGMTLTQIYSLYVESTDELRVQRDENQQLVSQLNLIAEELREKFPVMEEMRRDFEETVVMNQRLSSKVEAGLLECERLRQEADDAVRVSSQLKRENVRLEIRCKDTSQQVRALLQEVEEVRGGLSTTSSFDSSLAHVTQGDVSSSDEVISSQLVSFRNIEELQAQNEKLLVVVRELSEKQEEEERKHRDTELDELRQAREDAFKQLEELTEQRQRSKTIMDALVKQRDLYRVLAQSSSPNAAASVATQLNASRTLADMISPGSQASGVAQADDSFQSVSDLVSPRKDVDSAALQSALEELTNEFRDYKDQTHKNTEVLTTQLDEYRDKAASCHMDSAKLVSKLEYATERQEMLTANSESYRRELEATRTKNAQMNVSMAKIQMTLDSTSQDLADCKDRLRRSERKAEDLSQENRLVKSSEQQSQREIESLRRELRNQRTLLASLQTIQNNVERNDFEMRTRLAGQLETAQEELSTVRRRLDADTEYHRSVISAYESQLKDLREELTTERKQVTAFRDQVLSLKSGSADAAEKAEEFELQAKALQQELTALKERTEKAAEGGDGSEAARLALQVTKAEARVAALEEQLASAQQHVEQYKAISQASESALAELNQANDDFRDRYEQQLAAAKENSVEAEQRLVALQQEHEKLVGDNAEVERQFQLEVAELREQIGKLSSELSSALQSQSAAESAAQQARDDLRAQQTRATEAQDRYERELVLHAASMQELTTVREQLQEAAGTISDLTEKAEHASEQLNSTVRDYTDQLAAKSESLTVAEQKCSDWESQSDLLHKQLEKLSAQVLTLQSQLAAASKSHLDSAVASGREAVPSAEHSDKELREIIRFVRHEKEIAETKAELAQSESSRYSQRCDHLDRQLVAVREALEEERRRAQLHADTASHHAEIMEKVQTLNLLQDSNKLLREDRDRLQRRVVQLEDKCNLLEGEIAPLKESCHSITASRDTAVAERTALRAEVTRWTQRCSSLMEQCNKVDQQEYQDLLAWKESSVQEIATLKEQVEEATSAVETLELAATSLRGQCSVTEKKLVTARLENAKELELKAKEVTEMRKTLLDARRQSMRGNKQVTALQAKVTELETSLAAEKRKQDNTVAEEQIKDLKEQTQKLTADLEVAQESIKTKQTSIQELDTRLAKLNTMFRSIHKKSQTLQDWKSKAETQLERLKKQVEDKDTEVLSLRDQLEDMTSRYELAQGVEEGVVAGSSDQQAIAAEIAESVRSDTAASTPSSADEEAAVAESSEVGAMSSTQETANSTFPSSTQTPTVVVRPAAVATSNIGSPSSSGQAQATAVADRTSTPTASIRPMPTPIVLPPTAAVAPTPSIGQSSVFSVTTASSNTGVVASPPVSSSPPVAALQLAATTTHAGTVASSSVVQQAESTTVDTSLMLATQQQPAQQLQRGVKRQRDTEEEASSSVEPVATTASMAADGGAKRRRPNSEDDSSLSTGSQTVSTSAPVASSSSSGSSTAGLPLGLNSALSAGDTGGSDTSCTNDPAATTTGSVVSTVASEARQLEAQPDEFASTMVSHQDEEDDDAVDSIQEYCEDDTAPASPVAAGDEMDYDEEESVEEDANKDAGVVEENDDNNMDDEGVDEDEDDLDEEEEEDVEDEETDVDEEDVDDGEEAVDDGDEDEDEDDDDAGIILEEAGSADEEDAIVISRGASPDTIEIISDSDDEEPAIQQSKEEDDQPPVSLDIDSPLPVVFATGAGSNQEFAVSEVSVATDDQLGWAMPDIADLAEQASAPVDESSQGGLAESSPVYVTVQDSTVAREAAVSEPAVSQESHLTSSASLAASGDTSNEPRSHPVTLKRGLRRPRIQRNLGPNQQEDLPS